MACQAIKRDGGGVGYTDIVRGMLSGRNGKSLSRRAPHRKETALSDRSRSPITGLLCLGSRKPGQTSWHEHEKDDECITNLRFIPNALPPGLTRFAPQRFIVTRCSS